MSSNSNSTHTKKLPSFSAIKPYEQRAIVLRSEGKTAEVITNQINAEFGLAYSTDTINLWFMAGGRLEQANYEFTEVLAAESIKQAKLKLKKNTEKFVDTLIELTGAQYDSKTRLGAVKTGLNKYLPDKQVLISSDEIDDELPDFLKDQAEDILKTKEQLDGKNSVDNETQDETAH